MRWPKTSQLINCGGVAIYSDVKKFDRVTKIVLRLVVIAKTILEMVK